jgi:AcrR family transcriptional regulator
MKSTSKSSAYLSAADRRDQLIGVGLKMFSSQSMTSVGSDDIARVAGVSRSLLFHYFPTIRAFQVAVLQAAADELLELTVPSPELPVLEQLHAGLENFLDFIENNRGAYGALVTGMAGADIELRSISSRTHAELAEWMCRTIGVSEITPLLQASVRGWIAFVEEVGWFWLEEGNMMREEVVKLCESIFFTSVLDSVPESLRPSWMFEDDQLAPREARRRVSAASRAAKPSKAMARSSG